MRNEIMENENCVTVTVLFFAQSKELAGLKEAWLRLPEKISYARLLQRVTETFNLTAIRDNILLAKNEEVCEEGVVIEIKERDKIAVIPPLSGG